MSINLMLGKKQISSSSGIDTSKIDEHIDNDSLHISVVDRQNLENIKSNKGVFQSVDLLRSAYPTANIGDYCVCYNGTNYTMWTYNTDWVDTGVLGSVQDVNGLTGNVVLDATNINYSTGVTIKTEIDKKLNSDDVVYATNSDINSLF